ncbi:magnetosome protein MamE, partial [Candidatus Magnetoovum chiemensis]
MQESRRDLNDSLQRPIENCPKSFKPWVWTLLIMMLIAMVWAVFENYKTGGIVNKLINSDETFKNNLLSATYSAANIQNVPVKNVQQSYHDIIEKVRPSVISIDAVLSTPQKAEAAQPNLEGAPYSRVGSGVIIDPTGYVLSSLHVIAGAKSLKATVYSTAGAKIYPLKVVNIKEDTDLVLLRIQEEGPFPYAILGDSDNVRTGDIVLAMGSPFGFDQTITTGIISSTKRTITIDGKIYEDLFQTDTPINKGNSGGPLIDSNGNV